MRRKAEAGTETGKNTRSYSDNYANGSPASKTTPAQPAPTTVALAHSLGGDHFRRGCGNDHRDHCVYEVCVQLIPSDHHFWHFAVTTPMSRFAESFTATLSAPGGHENDPRDSECRALARS